MSEAYPGQAYWHEHNANIRRAEENWTMSHPQKRTVMQWLRDIFPGTFKSEPPVIMTEWGPVTESARLQAAMNMRADDGIKARVEAMLVKQCGSVEAGMAEARRRYPEAYE